MPLDPLTTVSGLDRANPYPIAVAPTNTPTGSPCSRAGRPRPSRTPPTRSPATTAAADPSPTPHAAKSRTTPHRTPPRHTGTHPHGHKTSRHDQDPGDRAPPGPNPDRSGTPRCLRHPRRPSPRTARASPPHRATAAPYRRSRSGRRRSRRPGCGRPPKPSSGPVTWLSRKSASRAALGWSKASVAGRAKPVAACSRLRSSTAVSESKPSSLNALLGATASLDA